MSSEGTSVASRICSSEPGEGIQLLEMKTPIDDVITLTGSLLGGQAFNTSGNQATAQIMAARSEERRVGKECRSRWSP